MLLVVAVNAVPLTNSTENVTEPALNVNDPTTTTASLDLSTKLNDDIQQSKAEDLHYGSGNVRIFILI